MGGNQSATETVVFCNVRGGRTAGGGNGEARVMDEGGKLKCICPQVSLQISSNMFFQTKLEKNITPPSSVVSGCQNGTVPEEAKIHLSLGLFANFIEHVFSNKT